MPDDANLSPQKHHTLTVCMVPPIGAKEAWAELTRARTKLRDPGLYRWPPHANLLYPFVSLRKKKNNGKENHDKAKDDVNNVIDADILSKLRNATLHCDPFNVTLDTFGTFGGRQRGVLWLYPKSSRDDDDQKQDAPTTEPLIQMQSLLEQEFPFCTDQRKQGGSYHPHMTLSHFPSLQEAQIAQNQVETRWSTQSFTCNEIHVLERKGDDGQFLRVATLGLGSEHGVKVYNPPQAFPAMPTVEEDWVREERKNQKERRKGSWKRRRRGRQRNSPQGSRGPRKSADTPEEIAAKRAARKAKRERLERERLMQDRFGELGS